MANTQGTRSPDEIEREIEVERSQLSETLEEIQDRFTFESLSADLMTTVKGQSGDIGRAISRSLKENPMAVALTAVGVAWMIMGPVRRGRTGYVAGYDSDDYDDDWDADDVDYGDTAASRSPRAEVMGSRYGAASTGMSPRPPARSLYTGSDWDEENYVEDDDGGEGRWDRARTFFSDKAEAASARASRAGHTASSAASSAGEGVASGASSAASAARSGASTVAGGVRSGASSAASGVRSGYAAAAGGVRSGYGATRSGAQRAYASARDLGARISEGTQDLSEEARRRVIAARERAYEAQKQAEYYARRGSEKAADLYEDQPLVMGGIALAVGAALGGILPRTDREDDAFGGYRDQVFEEAERIYREEREKIGAVAQATVDEARAAAGDFVETMKEDAKMVMEDAEDKAREAAQRVADKAKSEAEDKGVGQV